MERKREREKGRKEERRKKRKRGVESYLNTKFMTITIIMRKVIKWNENIVVKKTEKKRKRKKESTIEREREKE